MNQAPMIVLGVTSDLSVVLVSTPAEELARSYRVVVVSSLGPRLEKLAASGKVGAFAVQMDREISPLRDFRALLQLFLLFRRIRPRAIDFSTPKAGLLGMVAGWLARVPCRVYTLRGLRLETSQGWKRSVLMATEWIACKCAHRVICVGPSLRQRAIDLRLLKPEKALVLGSGSSRGVEVGRFLPTPENLRRAAELRGSLDLPEQVPVIGFVGRCTRDKGIAELLDAYDELRCERPDLRLLLVGGFENGDPVPQDLRTRIENDRLIVRPGFVSDVSPYYHLMDVLALPTYREGFPNVPLEAQAAGKPVVVTQATGAIDSVQDGKSGIVVPVGDASALARAIGSLLDDSAKRKEMGRFGQEWVMREFAHGRVMDKLMLEYRSLLGERLDSGSRYGPRRD